MTLEQLRSSPENQEILMFIVMFMVVAIGRDLPTYRWHEDSVFTRHTFPDADRAF